eukprot:8561195-Pyramimonas_sp.AAC.1
MSPHRTQRPPSSIAFDACSSARRRPAAPPPLSHASLIRVTYSPFFFSSFSRVSFFTYVTVFSQAAFSSLS